MDKKPEYEIVVVGVPSRVTVEAVLAKELFKDEGHRMEEKYLSILHAHDMIEKWLDSDSDQLKVETSKRVLVYSRDKLMENKNE